MGRFLKEHGKMDRTRAGKMMLAVGKTMSHSGQQRLAIRSPLVRLHQEVETFRYLYFLSTNTYLGQKGFPKNRSSSYQLHTFPPTANIDEH